MLDGKIALLVGGEGEIGLTVAKALARHGAQVVVVDQSIAVAEAVAHGAEGFAGRAAAYRADAAGVCAVDALLSRIIGEWGRIDCAFNNAHAGLSNMDVWDRHAIETQLAGNAASAVHWMSGEISAMKRLGGGAIVNTVSSLDAVNGVRFDRGEARRYVQTNLARAAAAMHGKDGVRINVVCPGPTKIEIASEALEAQFRMRLSPRGRPNPSAAEEVAEAVTWLFSSRSLSVSGQVRHAGMSHFGG